MNRDIDLTGIYTNSIKADFTDFIRLLNTPDTFGSTRDEFLILIYKKYKDLHASALRKLNTSLSDPGVERDLEAKPSIRKHKLQVDAAYKAAEDLYNDMNIPEQYRTIFINSIAYCLICRFKHASDPMDHQIRAAVKPEM